MKKFGALSLLFVSACGSAPPPKLAEPEPTETVEKGPRKGGLPSVSQELGSIDQKGVESTFAKLLNGPLEKCHTEGRGRLDFMNGDLKVFLRIDGTGRVKYSYFEETSVGDRDTEKCVLDALSAAAWPKPDGGEAEVRNSFHWEPGDARAPAKWDPEKVLSALDEAKEVKSSVLKCKSGAKGDLHLTAYVEPSEEEDAPPAKAGGKPKAPPKKAPGKKGTPGGKFKAIGVAATTKELAEKADCVVEALKPLRLPSPGSYAAKVSFVL